MSISLPAELSQAHLQNLQALVSRGFELVHFPLFAACIGVKKYGCAALLQPKAGGQLRLAAPPSYLIEGNISALVQRGGERWFVWKSRQVEATAERLEALRQFEDELRRLLEQPPIV